MTPNRLKIAVAAAGIGHVTRGVEVWANELAAALAAYDQDVILFRGSGNPSRSYERLIPCWRRDDPRTKRFVAWLPRFLWRLGIKSVYGIEQTSFALGILRFLRSLQIDILHVQDLPLARIVQAARKWRLIRTRVILGHGTDEPDTTISKFEYLQHLTPWHLEKAKARGCWKPTWSAIPNFVNTERFTPGSAPQLREKLGIPANAMVVLTSAAITVSVKRVDRLLDGFSEFRAQYPDVPAWLVVAGGRTRDTDNLIASAQARLGNRVHFLINHPPNQMAELYRIADVFALVSDREMMPVALLEAMASGLPCIVHRYPVLEWVAGPGGRVVDMAVPGALVAALYELLNDPPGRTDLGRAARDYCINNFSRETVIGQILSYYQHVMGQTPHPSRSHPRSNPNTDRVQCTSIEHSLPAK